MTGRPCHAAALRETFDQAALDYDAVRPGYPAALIDDIVNIAGLTPTTAILEVGCGTGQATLPFARRGHRMVCLDIGANMLAVARRNCRGYANVEFAREAFETWDPAGRTFALVLSATAFHWIPPDARYHRASAALADAGHIAIVVNYHPRPSTEFFTRAQSVYRRVVPEWADPLDGPSDDARIATALGELTSSGLFEDAVARRYPWSVEFTSERYVRLLNTFSGHRALPEDRRRELFQGSRA